MLRLAPDSPAGIKLSLCLKTDRCRNGASPIAYYQYWGFCGWRIVAKDSDLMPNLSGSATRVALWISWSIDLRFVDLVTNGQSLVVSHDTTQTGDTCISISTTAEPTDCGTSRESRPCVIFITTDSLQTPHFYPHDSSLTYTARQIQRPFQHSVSRYRFGKS